MKKSRRYTVSRKRTLQKSWKSLSKEDKGDLTKFVQILGVILVIILLLYYIMVSGLTHIGDFWSIFTGKQDDTQGDTTIPPPPTFTPISPYTNSKEININGYAEPAAEVILLVNSKEVAKTVTEAGGTFSFSSINLPKEGKNTITATATDRAGNKSQNSAKLIVTLDSKPPKLEISKPKNGQTFSGDENQIKVEGKTEPGVTVKVNNSQATVLADGIFKSTLTANEPGQIKITIVATDKAGNEEKTELTVTYESGG